MTWFLILMWCAGYGANSCAITTIPSGYTDEAECKTAGDREMKLHMIYAYHCVAH